jgi:hypothetical protein
MNEPNLLRRDQLLADGALGLLEGADATALDALLRDRTAAAEFAALERTAAMVALADPATAGVAMTSRSLDARLRDDAVMFFAERAATPPSAATDRAVPRFTQRHVAPWLLAAAAILLLLVRNIDAEPLSPARARAALLADASGLVRCEWSPGPSPQRGQLSGDVVFDPQRQQGFLRLRGLPELDPGHRYQLWIVDGTRQGPPVDGGLLGPRGAHDEVVVPITARLPVRQPAAFVLTIENADGVVVSAQEHVVAIAKP